MLCKKLAYLNIPDRGWSGRGGYYCPVPQAPPASLSLGLDWMETRRMQLLDWLPGRLRAYWQAAALWLREYEAIRGIACLPCLTPHTNLTIYPGHVDLSRPTRKQRKRIVILSADITADCQHGMQVNNLVTEASLHHKKEFKLGPKGCYVMRKAAAEWQFCMF